MDLRRSAGSQARVVSLQNIKTEKREECGVLDLSFRMMWQNAALLGVTLLLLGSGVLNYWALLSVWRVIAADLTVSGFCWATLGVVGAVVAFMIALALFLTTFDRLIPVKKK
jgi:hypothetical protein